MTDPGSMFELANLSPHWNVSLIAELEAPIARGIASLRAQSKGQECLGFGLITEFDYDGLLEEIDCVLPYPTKVEADAALIERLDAHEQSILARDAGWTRAFDNVFPRNMMPATMNVMPGNFGNQFIGRGYKHTIPYNSIYVRMIRIDGDNGDIVDQLLSFDGLKHSVVDCLRQLGKANGPPGCLGR